MTQEDIVSHENYALRCGGEPIFMIEDDHLFHIQEHEKLPQTEKVRAHIQKHKEAMEVK